MARTSPNLLSRYGKLLDQHVLLIRPTRGNFLTSNSLLFFDEEILIVDTGSQSHTGHLQALKKDISVDKVLFSHYHIDHILGSHIFPNEDKFIHELERTALQSLESYFQYCYQNRNISKELREKWVQRLMYFVKGEGISKWGHLNLVDVQSVQDNVIFSIGVTDLQVIHLPGHSPGHCGIFDPLSKILFIGDMELSSKFGPWYGWPNSDLPAFRESVKRIIDFIENHNISHIVSSHSPEINKVEGLKFLHRFNNCFDNRTKDILKYISSHKKGVSLNQIVNQSFIYQGKARGPSFVWKFFERIHIEQHIKELLESKEIQITGDLVKKL